MTEEQPDFAVPSQSNQKEAQGNVHQDQLIMEQERQIADEIRATMDMIGAKSNLSLLVDDYQNDPVFYAKAKNLQEQFSHMRRIRPDGNCFLRGFIFAYLDHCIGHKEELERFKKIIKDSLPELLELGFPKFTTEDFYDTFMEVLGDLSSSLSLDTLEGLLNAQGSCDYVVVYLRLLIAKHLVQNQDFFSCFIEGGRSVEEFCKQEVEPMYRECDHLHIVALCSALNVGVCVVYMDRGQGDRPDPHYFPDDQAKPLFHLLYRPGHYDIIYKKPDAEQQQESS